MHSVAAPELSFISQHLPRQMESPGPDEEVDTIISKAPQQLLSGPCGEIVHGAAVITAVSMGKNLFY